MNEPQKTYHAWRNDTPYSREEELFAEYLVSRYIFGNQIGLEGVTALGCLRPELVHFRNHAGIPARLVR